VGTLLLVRHGQTAWSAAGRHTSVTDLDLTPDGEAQAKRLGAALAGRTYAAVYSSPRLRARGTAELAGLAVTDVDDDLVEWDYGRYEGLTSAEIRADEPDWSLWTDGCPGGESPEQVRSRVDRALTMLAPGPDDDTTVVVIAHGHVLRVMAARWVGLPVAGGALLALDAGSRSELGYEHATRVVVRWNLPTD